MKKMTATVAALAAAAIFAAAGTARATFIMTLTSGSTTSITDNGVGDTDPAVGVISFTGSLTGFSLTVTSGTSNSPGDPGGAVLQLSSLAVRNTTAGQQTLTISLEDKNFTVPSSGLQLFSSLTGTVLRGAVNDGVSFQSYVDTNNVQGGTNTTSGLQSFLVTSGPVSGIAAPNANVAFSASGAYSMKNVTTIKLSAGAQANVSATSVVTGSVPEPASIGVLGMASLGLVIRRRRTV